MEKVRGEGIVKVNRERDLSFVNNFIKTQRKRLGERKRERERERKSVCVCV